MTPRFQGSLAQSQELEHKAARPADSPDFSGRAEAVCKIDAGQLLDIRLRKDRSYVPGSNRGHALRWKGRGRPLQIAALAYVRAMVNAGFLPRVGSLKCVDCGVTASAYDHRDYTKPVDVEPVCGSCNKRRGPGYPYNPQPLELAR